MREMHVSLRQEQKRAQAQRPADEAVFILTTADSCRWPCLPLQASTHKGVPALTASRDDMRRAHCQTLPDSA